MKKHLAILLSCAFAALTASGQGRILWDESVNGELSRASGSPTLLSSLLSGVNSVLGKTENVPNGGNWVSYDEYFTFNVPAGLSVTSVQLEIDKPNVWAWIGDSTFSTQLGFVSNPSSGNLLSQWGISSMGPGTYGMYLANTDQQPFTSIANYRLDFLVQTIPEPSTLTLAVLGFSLLGFYRRIQGCPNA